MSSKFKVGDRVRGDGEAMFAGRIGTVVAVEGGLAEADFGEGFEGHQGSLHDAAVETRWYLDDEDAFEVVSSESTADTEIEAMKAVAAAYETLDDDARERVHAYIEHRFVLFV